MKASWRQAQNRRCQLSCASSRKRTALQPEHAHAQINIGKLSIHSKFSISHYMEFKDTSECDCYILGSYNIWYIVHIKIWWTAPPQNTQMKSFGYATFQLTLIAWSFKMSSIETSEHLTEWPLLDSTFGRRRNWWFFVLFHIHMSHLCENEPLCTWPSDS